MSVNHVINFTISKKRTAEEEAFIKQLREACTFLFIRTKDKYDIENSVCDKHGINLNNCPTYIKMINK